LDILEIDGQLVKATGSPVMLRPDPSASSSGWGIRNGGVLWKDSGGFWHSLDALLLDDVMLFTVNTAHSLAPNGTLTGALYRIYQGQMQALVPSTTIWSTMTANQVDGEVILDWAV
jgi:hypothetical protein